MLTLLEKEALIKIKDKKQTKKFVMLALENSKPGEPLLLHDEANLFRGYNYW